MDSAETEKYDVIVAGAGLAGWLVAARLHLTRPDVKILVLDQDAHPGGRLHASALEAAFTRTGMTSISKNLFEFLTHTLQAFPSGGDDDSVYLQKRRETIGLLMANNLDTGLIEDIGSGELAGMYGGAVARREWLELFTAIKGASRETKLIRLWTKKKSPGAILLSHVARLAGIPDIWEAAAGALMDRLGYLQNDHCYGDWQEVFAALQRLTATTGGVKYQYETRILEGFHHDQSWHLLTSAGNFSATHLVVAHAPWQVTEWLERRKIPLAVLRMGLKSKPISLVTLCERLEGPCRLPDVTLIPAEQVEVIHNRGVNFCIETAIDFELSLDSLSVVKAIKRLKRARRKVQKALNCTETSGERIALLTIAWPNTAQSGDYNLISKLGDPDQRCGDQLYFVGDAYGSSYDPDKNLIDSVVSAADRLTATFA